MAIAYDNATHNAFSSTSPSFSHTCSGSDRLLVLGIWCGADNITAASYNSVSMTFINKVAMSGAAAGQYIYLYYLVNPASGSNTVSVTATGSPGVYVSAVSYTGVKQTSPLESNNTQSVSSTTTLTTSTTTSTSNAWLVGYAYHNGTVVAGTATTLRGGSANVLSFMDSGSGKGSPGSYSLETSRSPADFAGHVIAAFAEEAGSAPTFAPRLALLGVGR